MNDPAPPLGRGGWVCVALLLGLFAGGGITWAVLSRRPVKSPLIVYQLPPPGAVPPGASGAAKSESFPGIAADALDTAKSAPPPDEKAGAAPGPRLSGPADPDGETATVEWNGSSERLPLPALRIDNGHLLHNHPKAEGCLANALAALAPFKKKGFDLRDKVWDGDISLEEGKAVSCQLFKGNDYVFCVGTDAKGAKLSLQLYAADGAPADAEQSAQEAAVGASATLSLRCPQTGTYFVVVKLEAATQEKVPWGMVSAYR